MTRTCPICNKSVQHIWSHLSRVHKIDGPDRAILLKQQNLSMNEPSQTTVHQLGNGQTDSCNTFQLLHPFTALVAGMTGSGKTVWVQNLLEHATQVINPPPQRIVWSYSQWQPAYDHMIKTIPGIEFVKGIPHDLDEDWYFDPKINNLIVIDDQMTETSNDKRILNLFTKGSHHRNLSVIFLLQNLYFQGKIMRTLSLNAAYLVLFKNPRDKLQIATLGRQMYPGKTEHFLQKYEAAVQRPYGYLFVDLKPATADACRLRTNVLPTDQIHTQTPVATARTDGESATLKSIANYFERQGYMQPPLLKTLQNLDQQMSNVLQQPNVPAEVKTKEYSQLFNRYLNLQQQLHNNVTTRPVRQEVVHTEPLSDNPSLSQSFPRLAATPQHVPSTSQARDSGFESRKTIEMSPSSFESSGVKTSTPAVAFSPVPLRTPSSFEMRRPAVTTLTSTPGNQPSPPFPNFLPTPPPTAEKRKPRTETPVKWIPYQDAHEYTSVMKPPRRSERLRAVAKLPPKWQKF